MCAREHELIIENKSTVNNRWIWILNQHSASFRAFNETFTNRDAAVQIRDSKNLNMFLQLWTLSTLKIFKS